LPLRSRASAITGGALAVDRVVICGDTPSRSKRAAGDLGVPERGALLGVAVDRTQQRVDVQKRALLDTGQQRGALRERHQVRTSHRGELVACPKVNSRKKIPNVEGAYTSSNTRAVPPARNTPASSMLSAPQAIAAMIEVSLPAGLTAPDFTRVDGSSTCSPINSESPVCSANSSTGTNPAADTRFRSSNTADPTVNVYDDCTENAFPNSG